MGTIWSPELLDGQGPKYKAVMQVIRQRIAEHDLTPGDKLPPVRDLAWSLGITPGTVARAYTLLTDDGTLMAEVGRGTFVAQPNEKGPLFADVPIEIDSVAHNSGAQAWNVNLFSPHLPSVGQATLIRRLLADVAQDPPSGVMHYPTRTSSAAARTAAAAWLAGAPLGSFGPDDIVLANGGQNAILLVFQALLKGRRPAILVEDLAYPGFRRAAELLRADVIPVEMDAQGVIPEALGAAANAHDAQVFCTSPEVHNPTCGFTPLERREALAKVAKRQDLQILEDDCYRLGQAQAPSYRMIVPERTWYISSISKSITPALRLGIAVTPKGRANILRRTAEYSFFGLPTPMTDLFAALLVHDDLPDLMADVRKAIGTYVQRTVNILGGYDIVWRKDVPFLWLRLPEGWRAGAFVQAAAQQGVGIRAAEDYACRDARTPHAVRMAINAGVSLQSFEAAIERLRDLLDNPPDQIGV
ncbi:PLP-dependent aminotransferase family protein [Tateyamaria sp. ANG-S1]|uniref:aminotransferase-like domain-containing protein n=1 Tax=Tateyamaria sp. ANG-S1 TaxID=1577905 RepID=UPI00057FA117|nr:PLP-dependent aminotransferase family protein [Tateyamaria sp. ANG-S1]KIC48630.1 aspartate aminotransferase [Tateyamaria sp. ANG-S1]